MTRKIIANKLHAIQDSISGTRNHPEIKETLNQFGYGDIEIAEGQAKLDKVKVLMAQQIDLYGDQYAATELAGKNWEKAYSEYMVVLKDIEELHSNQLEKKGEAQQSTLERDKAFDDLTNWYSDFRAIARIALYEKPQLIEALGIVKK